jgi:FKBP-type peptidyl-prolyl cis-trans isomerase
MSKVTAVPLRPVSRAGLVALWLGIALFVAVGLGAAWYLSKPAVMTAMPTADFLTANGKRSGIKTTPSGLEYQVIEPGAGPTPTPGDVARIEYRGTLVSGVEFDATKKGQTADMPVGQVIPGFAEALTLMPRGSRYRIWIPPALGYGDRPAGTIPPGSILVFDVRMHEFAPLPQQQMMPGAPGM